MPFKECLARLISRLAMVPSRKIENATLTKEEFGKVKEALDFINRYPNQFKIVDMADACADDIERILGDIDFSIDAVCIDYLGIMKPNGGMSEDADWLRQGVVAYEVRAIGRKMDLPIFSVVQLNRKPAGKEVESVGLSRLARSGTIATHATCIMQIEDRTNEVAMPDMSITIIKNRNGLRGQFSLMKHLHCAYLQDVPFIPNDYDAYFPNVDDISEEIDDIDNKLELDDEGE
jgi:replicative DNA helicase